jgi:hypothetical protein
VGGAAWLEDRAVVDGVVVTAAAAVATAEVKGTVSHTQARTHASKQAARTLAE